MTGYVGPIRHPNIRMEPCTRRKLKPTRRNITENHSGTTAKQSEADHATYAARLQRGIVSWHS